MALKEDFIDATKIVGREKIREQALYYSISSSMFLIKGKEGTGKTILGKSLISSLKDYRIIFLDAEKKPKNINIEKLYFDSQSIFEKLKKSKETILIVDNADGLTRRNLERIKYYYDQNYFISVLFIALNDDFLNNNSSIKSRIGSRIIELDYLDEKKVYDFYFSLVTSPKFSFLQINDMYKKVNYNLKNFLKEISHVHPEIPFNEEKIIGNKCLVCNTELEKIRDEWRCKKCETYCNVCGQRVGDNDLECPRCLAVFR